MPFKACLLILVMVVDLGIPEESLLELISIYPNMSEGLNDLVTITPEKGLCAYVLVRVFYTFLQRGHVVPMLPMLVPKILCIQRGKYEGWNDNAAPYQLQLVSL